MLDFSEDQERALDAAEEWRRGSGKPYLAMGGYAGTGKSTIVSYLSEQWGNVSVCALCGKAAHVLREKGSPATTIHSLIYVPFEDAQGKTRFARRPSVDASVIVVDEASMIDHVLLQDLLSFKVPVLFVGDHGQLEPIGTNPNLMKEPDVRLEKIHRQAHENPILRLAVAFREGRGVPYWSDKAGILELLPRREFERRVGPGWQIICGYNKTRRKVNDWIREISGYERHLICPGERLLCLRNNKQWNLFNGQQVTVVDVRPERKRTITVTIRTDEGRTLTVDCLKEQLGRDLVENFRSEDVVLFDYGYCLTAHKSQGSEWPAVLVLEEVASCWDARRWRYTVATRAKERLVYCA